MAKKKENKNKQKIPKKKSWQGSKPCKAHVSSPWDSVLLSSATGLSFILNIAFFIWILKAYYRIMKSILQYNVLHFLFLIDRSSASVLTVILFLDEKSCSLLLRFKLTVSVKWLRLWPWILFLIHLTSFHVFSSFIEQIIASGKTDNHWNQEI